MKWLASVAALLVLSSAGACVHRRDPRLPPEPPADPADAGARGDEDAPNPERAVTGVRFEVDPPDAEIIIDEKSYGPATALGRIPLDPGIYRVAVKAPGYGTWRAEITVGTQVEVLQVALPRR